MKKLILLLSLILIITGCSVQQVKEDSIDGIITTVFSKDTKLANTYFEGYKFYLPRGMKLLDKNEYNSKIAYNNNVYYIYVDAISYYHETKQSFNLKKDSYFAKEFDYNAKKGYIQIDKVEDKYFLQIYFNYAKVEAYVYKKDIEDSVMQIGSILSSLKFNDEILETIIGDNILDYKEETFRLFDTKEEDSNFLDYVDEYDNYNDISDENKDEDVLDTELIE